MMKRIFLAVILLCLVVGSALAQNRANFAWWNSEVVSDLNLTEAQRQQIRSVVKSFRPKLIDARSEFQKAQGDLQDVLNSEHIDPAQAQPVIQRLAKAQAASTEVFTEMSIQMRAVLSLDQWRELVKRWGSLQKGQKPTDTQVQP
jgi:Spy/CpxP family protein refolding chaperone